MNKKIHFFLLGICFFTFASGTMFAACIDDGLGHITCDAASGSETEADLSAISLTKTGGGETILEGSNSFSALNPAESHITINSGTLSLAEPSSLTGNFTLNLNGGNFKTSGNLGFNNTFVFGGGNLLVDSGTLTLNGDLSGNINKSGLGVLELQSSNMYTGALSISGGGVVANSDSFNGSAVLNGGAVFLTLENNTDAVLSGNISGLGIFNKTGGGTLTLTGANTAALDIQGGKVVLSSADNAQGDIKLSGGTLQTEGDLVLLNKITFNSGSLYISEDEALALGGALDGAGFDKNGLGVLIIEKDSPLTNAYLGNISVNDGGIFTNTGSFNGSAILNGEDTFIVFEEASSSAFGGAVSGSGTFVKTGAGTLTITGANSMSVTDITEGALSISSSSNIQGNIHLSGGELIATESLALGNGVNQNILLDSSDKGINVAAGKRLTFDSGITLGGTGCDQFNNCPVLLKEGAGTLVLNHNVSGGRYLADTFIKQGVLEISKGDLLGDTAFKVIIDGAVLKITDNSDIDNEIQLLSGGGSLDITGNTVLQANTSGSGSLVKNGGGTLVFEEGLMSHAGGTVINSGGIEGTTSNLAGNIQVNSGAFLNFSQDSDGSSNTVLSGLGAVNKYGQGIVNLANTNTFAGVFNIEEGGLRGSNKSFSSDINVAGAASVIFNHTCSNAADCLAFNGEFNKVITGGGALIKEGNAELYLKGVNSYSGGTYLQNSTRDDAGIYFTDEAALGTGNIYISNSNLTLGGDLSAGREIVFGSGVNSLTVKNNHTAAIDGVLSGTSFLKTGEGELILNADNTFTDGVMISSGVITIAKESALGVGMLSLNGEGTLKATDSFDTDKLINIVGDAGFDVASGKVLGLNYALYGGGTVVKKGLGTLELNYYNQYTGGISVEGGLLKGNADSIVGDIAVSSGASLEFEQKYNGHYVGDINSLGTIIKSGAGALVMEGDSENLNLLAVNNFNVNEGGVLLASNFQGNANIAHDAFLSLEADAKGSFESYGRFYIDNSKDINIEGDITIKNGGALNLFVDEAADTKIHIKQNSASGGGNITIENGGKIEVNAKGVFAAPATFDFLKYDGIFTGSIADFDISVINNRRLLADITDTGDGLSFTITRLLSHNASLGGLNASQRSIAAALDKASAAPKADMETILNALDYAVLAGVQPSSIFQLGGFIYANLPNTFSRFKNNAYLRINRSPAQDSSFSKNIWVQSVNNFSDIKPTDTSSDLYLLSNGFTVGLDNYYEDFGLTGGLFAGYARHNLKHNKTENLNGDEYQAGIYILKQGEVIDIQSAFSLGYQDDSVQRDINFIARRASSRVKSYGANFDFEAGFTATDILSFKLRPFAGITAYLDRKESFTETGAAAADLSSEGKYEFLTEGRLGLGLYKKSSSFSYYADAFVKQNLNTPKTKLSISGQTYEVKPADIGAVFGFTAGAVKSFSEALSVYVNGGIDINNKMQKYFLNLGLRTYW